MTTKKAELMEILKSDNVESFKKYVESGNKIDYAMSYKFGDLVSSYMPLAICIFQDKPNLLNYMINNLSVNELEKQLSPMSTEVNYGAHMVQNKKFAELKVLEKLGVLSNYTKEKIETQIYALSLEEINANELGGFLKPEVMLKKIVNLDDAQRLMEWIDKNPSVSLDKLRLKDANTGDKISVLSACTKSNAVFCMEVFVEQIKAEKIATLNKSKPKI